MSRGPGEDRRGAAAALGRVARGPLTEAEWVVKHGVEAVDA